MMNHQTPIRSLECDHAIRSPESHSAATIRRLSDTDVRAIFESLHHGAPPPSHLDFQIVPIGPTGLKLSPPAIEFEDGLYVLLRPVKKRKHAADEEPNVPSHLRHLVMKESLPETCPWSLSGPQFPQPTAIQQRYCYPKGRHEYSKQKGGALWTMYGTDGKEDVEYRLLHVYYSAKRAINKGVSIPDDETTKSIDSPIQPNVSKRQKVARLPSPPSIHTSERTPPSVYGGYRHHYVHPVAPSPYYPSPRAVASPMIGSALSFDNLTPPSPVLPFNGSNFVTPNSDHYFRYTASRPIENRWAHTDRNLVRPPIESFNITHSPVRRSRSTATQSSKTDGYDNFYLDLSASWQDIDCCWEDPLMNIVTRPSNDSSASGNGMEQSDSESFKSDFSHRLQVLKQTLHENIIAASVDDQDELLQMLDDWGQTLADDVEVKLTFPSDPCDFEGDMAIHDFLTDDERHPIDSFFSEAV